MVAHQKHVKATKPKSKQAGSASKHFARRVGVPADIKRSRLPLVEKLAVRCDEALR